jgi:uncharacterized protein YjfI (DUF2170 family)
VLLFFSLALIFNVSESSAASVNQTNINASATSLDNVTANSLSNYTTGNANTTLNTDIKKVTANETKNPNLNNTMAAGAPVLVNGLSVAQLKDGTSRVQAFFNKYNKLPTYVSFGTRQIPTATFEKNIATQGLKINTVIVNGLNIGQINDGISRVNAYYAKYGKLPTYVSFGTRQIPIATFQKNIATQGLNVNTLINGLNIGQINDGISRVNAYYAKYGRLPAYVSFGTRHILIATFEQNIAAQGLKITTSGVTQIKPDTSSVAALAKSLKGSTTYNTAVNLFNWVRDKIGYSFYYNTKYGAAGTLANMTGNCCDTANLLVALARADGITTRYVHGYCDFSSGWYGHVWAQLYVNGKWYTADATSYGNSLGVIKNWNTTTYTIYGTYNTLPF